MPDFSVTQEKMGMFSSWKPLPWGQAKTYMHPLGASACSPAWQADHIRMLRRSTHREKQRGLGTQLRQQ